METKDIALLQQTPLEVIELASIQAKLLMDIVDKTECYIIINDKKYLQVEAWETIGAFNRIHALTQAIVPIIKDGETTGYEANVQLIKDGQSVGGAIMPCYFTENACKGKEGDARHKASMSAAQTFATSKAYRMNFSYIAILAGYQPTPAEEMEGEEKKHITEHWCSVHNTKFFKKGHMKGYAHKIEGTEKWCNEPSPKTITSMSEPSTPEASTSELSTSEVSEEESGAVYPIDLDWLKETLDTLQSKKLKAWTDANVLSYLKAVTGQPAQNIKEAVQHLSQEQAEQFAGRLNQAVELS